MAIPQPATVKYLKEICGKKVKTSKNEISLDIGNGKSISGITTIAKHLLKASEGFKGLNLEDRIFVEQWLEFSPLVSTLEAAKDREKLQVVLQDFNRYLEDKVYFAASQLTVADILIFHSLHPVFERMTFHEKEKIVNLSRWFSHIQCSDKALQSLTPLTFLRTTLYDGAGHH